MMSRLEIQFPTCLVMGAPTGARPSPGFYVGRDGWKGWDDGPAGRREAVARPATHGEFDLPVTRGSRVPLLDGFAFASTEFELGRMRAQWTGIGADGEPFRMVVKHQGETLWATARQINAFFTDEGQSWRRLKARISLELVCADPRKYGGVQVLTGSTVQARNYGNFPASPVVEVAGPRTAPYTITGPGGRVVTVTQALAAGQTHRIDFSEGGIYRNGVRQLGGLSHFQPWSIPAGGVVPMSISVGQMTVTVTDTYM